MNLLRSDAEFLGLGGSQLERLSCRAQSDHYVDMPPLSRLTKMTTLTRLELIGYETFRNFKQLHSMQLAELILVDLIHLDVVRMEHASPRKAAHRGH